MTNCFLRPLSITLTVLRDDIVLSKKILSSSSDSLLKNLPKFSKFKTDCLNETLIHCKRKKKEYMGTCKHNIKKKINM